MLCCSALMFKMEQSNISNKIKLISHRGLSDNFPENSLAAFELAGGKDYYGIECDIRFTLDGYLVVIHDRTSRRVADLNFKIKKHFISTLRQAFLKNTDGTKSELKIPTLEEYLDVCKNYNKIAVLELKTIFTTKQTAALLKKISKYHESSKTIIISKYFVNLKQIRQQSKNQRLQLIKRHLNDKTIKKLSFYNIDADIYYKNLTAKTVNKCHEYGVLVNCWTCNDPSYAEHLIKIGVDYITTDTLGYNF